MSTTAPNVASRGSEVPEDYDLPEGWIAASLGSVSEKITDGTHKTPEYTSNGVRFLSTANLIPFKRGFDFSQYERFISQAEHRELTKRCLPEEGDILISKCGTIGRTKEVDVEYPFSIFVGLALLRPIPSLFSPGFLECFLNSPEIQHQFDEFAPGSTRRTLTLNGINRVLLRIPPLAEQKRIVTKCGQLFAQLNASHARLAKVRLILKRFRQAVLADACSEGESLPLSEIVLDIKYGTAQKCTPVPEGSPVLRIPNIGDGSVRHDDLKYAKLPPRELAALRLMSGDILMIRSNGSVSLVGKTALVSEREAGFAYAGYLIRLRADRGRVLPEYLDLALQTHSVREQIEIPARSTSGVHNINSTEVLSLKINLPALDAQKANVCRVEALFNLADAIEKRVEVATKRAEKLTQAILAKAFRGELVPTEAELARREGREYQPASALLARIRAQREKPAKTADGIQDQHRETTKRRR